MKRRTTYRPLRTAQRITRREHIAAALGAATGLIAMTLAAISVVVIR